MRTKKKHSEACFLKVLSALCILLMLTGACSVSAASVSMGSLAACGETGKETKAADMLGDADLDAEHEAVIARTKWKTNYTKEDLKYLSCVIYCETEPLGYEARVALGNIVLNRVADTKDWGHVNTIKEVIYDTKWSRQFDCTSGKVSMMDRALKLYESIGKEAEASYAAWQIKGMTECIQVAKDVMCGVKAVPDDFVFCRGKKYFSKDIATCEAKHCYYLIIESHIYFSNTPAY